MQKIFSAFAARVSRLPIIGHVVLWGLVGALLAPALSAGGFWWTDETRHAMGGVFILDFVRELPLANPMEYAFRYFAQYPALALNWYLPGFYAAEALFYSVFGISEPTAHWTVLVFCLMAVSVWFAWARKTWGVAVAFFAAALLVSAPEWNFWARSVMLEAPAIAMFIISIWFFERYLDKATLWRAMLAGAMVAGALLFKQTIALLMPAMFFYALWSPRRSALWDWRAAPAYVLVIAALAIMAIHTLKFGSQGLSATLGDVGSGAGVRASRFALQRWLVYPIALVHTWGWPLMILSAIGMSLPSKGRESGLPLLYAWLFWWYVPFTLLFGDPDGARRYTMYVFPVLAVFAARPLLFLRDHASMRVALSIVLLAVLFYRAWRSFEQPVPHVDGYREAAAYVHKLQTRSPLLFAGKYDGSFIFHLRQLNDKRDDVVLRADKVLVSIAVQKNFGVQSHVGGEDDIRALIKRYGIEFILVEQPDLVGVKEFGMLYALMQRPDFERVKVLPVTAGGGAMAPDRVEVFRYRDHKPADSATIVIPLPHMGREIRFKRD
jgi:hypothetical protein